jgi:hypothetical protein
MVSIFRLLFGSLWRNFAQSGHTGWMACSGFDWRCHCSALRGSGEGWTKLREMFASTVTGWLKTYGFIHTLDLSCGLTIDIYGINRGQCYDDNFRRFSQIFGEKIAISLLKNNVMIQLLYDLVMFWVKKRRIFWRKYFKIITSVPGMFVRPKRNQDHLPIR